MNIRKILIIKFRNIGDVLLSTPLLENLRFFYPGAEIHTAVNKMCEEMLSLNPSVDRILVYDRETIKKSHPAARMAKELRYFRQICQDRYDLVINLTEGDRGTLLALFSGAHLRFGFRPRGFILDRLPAFTVSFGQTPHVHTVERDLAFLQLLGINPRHKKVRIYWSDKAEQKINELLAERGVRKFVHVHPVARWLFKCWDAGRFAEIIDYIENEKRLRAVITASPDPEEQQRVAEIINACRCSPLNLSGMLNLKEVACLSNRASFFLGVDTAPMHMAAAVNTPVVALFGNSDPVIWGPWENDSAVCRYRNMRTVQKNGKHIVLQKGHGRVIKRNGRKISTALMNITVGEVQRAVDQAASNTV